MYNYPYILVANNLLNGQCLNANENKYKEKENINAKQTFFIYERERREKEKSSFWKWDSKVWKMHYPFIVIKEETRWTSVAFFLDKDNVES